MRTIYPQQFDTNIYHLREKKSTEHSAIPVSQPEQIFIVGFRMQKSTTMDSKYHPILHLLGTHTGHNRVGSSIRNIMWRKEQVQLLSMNVYRVRQQRGRDKNLCNFFYQQVAVQKKDQLDGKFYLGCSVVAVGHRTHYK